MIIRDSLLSNDFFGSFSFDDFTLRSFASDMLF